MSIQKTILIAEDDVSLLQILRMRFERDGFEVKVALNGEEALNQIFKKKPDLLLLDVVMPKKGGFEVIRRLKAREETQNIPIIILTNSGDPEEVEESYRLGVKDYIVKANIKLEEVSRKVKKVLEGK